MFAEPPALRCIHAPRTLLIKVVCRNAGALIEDAKKTQEQDAAVSDEDAADGGYVSWRWTEFW
eukprot:2669937-Rhodomonas_salina.1